MPCWGLQVMNKIQVMEQFGRAVQMFIQSLTNDDAMEVAMIYPKYIVVVVTI